jgi:hypothetical protein
MDRDTAAQIIGYPDCVNETYGLMRADCLIDAYASQGIIARQKWVTYQEAWAICHEYTGVINPMGMYHFMAIRGVESQSIWVANSAKGYRGVYENIDYDTFIAYGPVQVIYLESYQ